MQYGPGTAIGELDGLPVTGLAARRESSRTGPRRVDGRRLRRVRTRQLIVEAYLDLQGEAPIRVNRDLPDTVKTAIAARLPIVEVGNQVSPLGFANPSCIVRDPATGELTGMNEIMSPWAGGAAQ